MKQELIGGRLRQRQEFGAGQELGPDLQRQRAIRIIA
jgi:hypothetical protein